MTNVDDFGKVLQMRCAFHVDYYYTQREGAFNIELLFRLPNMRYILRSVEYWAGSGNEV